MNGKLVRDREFAPSKDGLPVMSFFEDIAAALDAEGIESRVNDDVLFVPITSELEIQFVEIDPLLPAANVYIAAADVDEDDDDFEAVLVSVAFSVEAAVQAVARHIATDQVVTVLRDLLEGTDERIAELDFVQDDFNPHLVVAEVAEDSELRVLVEANDGTPSAVVRFLSFDVDDNAFADDDYWDWDDEERESQDADDASDSTDSDSVSAREDNAIINAWNDPLPIDDEEERIAAFPEMVGGPVPPLIEVPAETLELGTYTDFDRLFDVLGLVVEQAADWESQLIAFSADDFDEPDVYDIFGADDADFSDDLEDLDLDDEDVDGADVDELDEDDDADDKD